MRTSWAVILVACSPCVVGAAAYDWNLDANGNWNAAANWLPNTGFPNAIDDVANLGPVTTARRGLSLGGGITIGTITCNNPHGYSIGSPLTFQVSSGSAAFTYNNNPGTQNYDMTGTSMVFNSDVVITKNATTSMISYSISTISGSGGLTLNGTGGGSLRFTGGSGSTPNTYSGLTTINACTLMLNKLTRGLSGNVLINAGGTLETNVSSSGTSALFTNITLDGGTLRLNTSTGANIFTFNSGTTTGAGSISCVTARLKAVTAAGGITLTSASGGLECIDTSGSVLISGPMSFSVAGVPVNVPRLSQPIDLSLTGVISGSGGYTLTNTGIVEIAGSSANSITGTLTVLNGTLLLNKTGADSHFGPMTINGGTVTWLQPNQLGVGIGATNPVTLTSGTMDMGSFSDALSAFVYQGGTFLNPPATLTLTNGTAPLTMRNTTINTNVAFTSTGTSAVITYDNTNDGQATINGNVDLGTRSRAFSIAARPVPTNISMSINGSISGTSGMTVTGAGVLELTGSTDNTLTGTVSSTSATLLLNKSLGARALPGLTVTSGTARCLQPNQFLTTGAVTLSSSTSLLDLNGFQQTIGSLTFNSGTLSQGGATLTLTSASTALTIRNRTISGPIALTGGGGIAFNTALGGSATISGPVNLGGNVTTIDIPTGGTSPGMTISGAISNGGIVKTGTGVLSLTGANTYAGGTTVSAGTLSGDSTALQGAIVNNATLTFNQSTDGIYSGNVTGTGTMTKQGTGLLTTTGSLSQTSVTISGGTLAVNGTLTAPVTVADGAKLQGTGTLAGSFVSSGVVQPGNSIGELHFSGSFTLTSTATLEIELDATGNDLVVVSGVPGTAAIDAGATLNIVPLPGFVPTYSNIPIFTATGGITGTFSTISLSNPNFQYTISYLPNQIDLTLTFVPFANLPLSGNARSIASCMDSATIVLGSDFESVFNTLHQLSLSDLQEALNQLQPSLFKGMILSQENNTFLIRSIVNRRLEELYETGCNRKAAARKGWSLWGAVSGDFLKQSSIDTLFGFRSTTGSFNLGADYGMTSHCTVGFSTAYTGSSLNWNESAGSGNSDSLYTSLYASGFWDHAFVNGILLSALSRYHETRSISFGTINRAAHNAHNGWEGLGHVDFGGIIPLKALEIRPFGGVDFLYLRENHFNEQGASSLNLNVDRSTYTMLRAEAGLAVATCFKTKEAKWIPDLKGAYVHERRWRGASYQANLMDQPCQFTVIGMNPTRGLFSGSAGLSVLLAKDRSILSLQYTIQAGSHLLDQGATLQLIHRF